MKKKIVLILLIFMTFFAGITVSEAVNDKLKLYKYLLDTYGNLNSVSLEFISINNPGMAGSLKAEKGSKYILKMGKRNIYCDGKTVWNYSTTDNNVVISSFDSSGTQFSFEQFFFNYLQNYKPDQLKKAAASSGYIAYILTLKPASEDEKIGDVEYIDVWINKKDFSLKMIEIGMGGNKQAWEISSLELNPEFAHNEFKFEPPGDAEVIDLRQ